ncbi:MAG: Crp/Fnr family transcriptional regulator [Acidobacteria bacterium]|nr:Crp/Fnr family transcriptional regulator [Acidobacteriota bacterium]
MVRSSTLPLSLRLPSGAKLFDPDHPSQGLYWLRSGRVRLSTDGEAILDYLRPGDFFGEEFLLPREQRHRTAVARSPVQVTGFSKPQLLTRLRTDRRFALRLLRNLASRAGRYERAIRDFVTDPAEVRLARLLLRLAPARPASGWVRLPFPLTNPELAQMIGTTRWRVSHFLHHFCELGWLRLEKGIRLNREGLAGFLAREA